MRISFEFSQAELDAVREVAKSTTEMYRQMADGVDKICAHISSLTKDGTLTVVLEPKTTGGDFAKKIKTMRSKRAKINLE